MNRVINIGILLLLVLFISFRVNVACNELRSDRSSGETKHIELPVSFSGTIPCNSCPDIQYFLTLESEKYVENSLPIDEETAPLHTEGLWELKSDTLYIYSEYDIPVKRFLWRDYEIILLDQDNSKVSSLNLKAE